MRFKLVEANRTNYAKQVRKDKDIIRSILISLPSLNFVLSCSVMSDSL